MLCDLKNNLWITFTALIQYNINNYINYILNTNRRHLIKKMLKASHSNGFKSYPQNLKRGFYCKKRGVYCKQTWSLLQKQKVKH